jgi:flagellar hook-length control protein FliK
MAETASQPPQTPGQTAQFDARRTRDTDASLRGDAESKPLRAGISSASADAGARADGGTAASVALTGDSNQHAGDQSNQRSLTAAQRLIAERPTGERNALSEADHRALGSRLQRGLGAALRQGSGAVTLRLVPETLGQVRIAMNFQQGQVSVEVQTQNPAALRAVSDHLSSLRSSLEARGLTVDRLGASLMSARPGSEANSQTNHQHQSDSGAGRQSTQHDAGDGRSRGSFGGREHERRNGHPPPQHRSDGEHGAAPDSRFDFVLRSDRDGVTAESAA